MISFQLHNIKLFFFPQKTSSQHEAAYHGVSAGQGCPYVWLCIWAENESTSARVLTTSSFFDIFAHAQM